MTLCVDLTGKTALVTGAGRGIGLAIAHTLRDAGAQVVATDADPGLVAEIESGVDTTAVLDVTDPGSARAALRMLAVDVGLPDILVNNAGIASRHHGLPFTNQGLAEWSRVADVNLFGTVNVTAEWVKLREPSAPGVVVNIASVAGRKATQTDPAYSAAKAAVLSFTRSCAQDLAPAVRVCAVCPGMVHTSFYEAQYELTAGRDTTVAGLTSQDFFDRKAAALIPMGRGQSPLDVAFSVAFLASDLAASITGQALNVDGGLVMS